MSINSFQLQQAGSWLVLGACPTLTLPALSSGLHCSLTCSVPTSSTWGPLGSDPTTSPATPTSTSTFSEHWAPYISPGAPVVKKAQAPDAGSDSSLSVLWPRAGPGTSLSLGFLFSELKTQLVSPGTALCHYGHYAPHTACPAPRVLFSTLPVSPAQQLTSSYKIVHFNVILRKLSVKTCFFLLPH